MKSYLDILKSIKPPPKKVETKKEINFVTDLSLCRPRDFVNRRIFFEKVQKVFHQAFPDARLYIRRGAVKIVGTVIKGYQEKLSITLPVLIPEEKIDEYFIGPWYLTSIDVPNLNPRECRSIPVLTREGYKFNTQGMSFMEMDHPGSLDMVDDSQITFWCDACEDKTCWMHLSGLDRIFKND